MSLAVCAWLCLSRLRRWGLSVVLGDCTECRNVTYPRNSHIGTMAWLGVDDRGACTPISVIASCTELLRISPKLGCEQRRTATMASVQFRRVEGWKAIVEAWLAVASFHLVRWYLDVADVPPGFWRFGMSVALPFAEADAGWLRHALSGDDEDAAMYRVQDGLRRGFHAHASTHVRSGARPSVDEVPT